jgi:hypothetical protein
LDEFPAWLPFLPLFLSLRIGIVASLSWFGWAALARAYRLAGEFDGRCWRFGSAVVRYAAPWRHARYRCGMTLGANARGLDLAVLPLFRIGHPPLFIPWTDVSVARHDSMLLSCLEFRFRRVETVSLRLNWSLGQEVAAAGGLAVPK